MEELVYKLLQQTSTTWCYKHWRPSRGRRRTNPIQKHPAPEWMYYCYTERTPANMAKFISNGCGSHTASKMKRHAVGWEWECCHWKLQWGLMSKLSWKISANSSIKELYAISISNLSSISLPPDSFCSMALMLPTPRSFMPQGSISLKGAKSVVTFSARPW